MDIIKKGRYLHFKDKSYELVDIVFHSETQKELVLYKQLYKSNTHDIGTLWVRPKEMFFENVEVNGKKVPRFKYIGK